MSRVACTLVFVLALLLSSVPLIATVRALGNEINLPALIKALASSNLSSATQQAIKYDLAKLWKYENKGLKPTENCNGNITATQCVKKQKQTGSTYAYDAAVAALQDTQIVPGSENGRLVCIVTGKCYQCDFHGSASFKYLVNLDRAIASKHISCQCSKQ